MEYTKSFTYFNIFTVMCFFSRHNLGFVSYILINNPFNDALMYFKDRCGLIAFIYYSKHPFFGSDEKLYKTWIKEKEFFFIFLI